MQISGEPKPQNLTGNSFSSHRASMISSVAFICLGSIVTGCGDTGKATSPSGASLAATSSSASIDISPVASESKKGALLLPEVMMTPRWPLNQTVLQFPEETRSLKSSWHDGYFTAKPIRTVFAAVFGANHIGFDTTMPWVVIDSKETPSVFTTVTINYPEWGSDDGQTCAAMSNGATRSTHWPAKAGVIEGASDPGGDHHMLVMDVSSSRLYELFGVTVKNPGTPSASYSADAARCWDTTKPQHGNLGQNSADAAGLPILPLLLRYDEANSGKIRHALRFTVNATRANNNGGAFTLPASHAAGNNWSSMAYEGMRLKLRADFDPRSFSKMNQTIITALKTYGIVVADNGQTGLITSDLNSSWNTADLALLRNAITLNDFIPVDSGKIVDASGQAVQ